MADVYLRMFLGTNHPCGHEENTVGLGNVSSADGKPPGLPGWLIARFAQLAEAKRQLNRECLEAAFRLDSVNKLNLADNFLRANGERLKPARGGSQLYVK